MFFRSPSWRCLPSTSVAVKRPPAYSAGPRRPLHNQLFPGDRRGDRCQEFQERHQAITLVDLETGAQRIRQRLFAYQGHEPGARLLPERGTDKGVQPPLAPTLQRAAIDLLVGLKQFSDAPDPLSIQ